MTEMGDALVQSSILLNFVQHGYAPPIPKKGKVRKHDSSQFAPFYMLQVKIRRTVKFSRHRLLIPSKVFVGLDDFGAYRCR